MKAYEPVDFWDGLIAKNFDLRSTGHASYGIEYNRVLYRAKTRCLRDVWRRIGISPANQDVLELACGVGFFTDLFVKCGARVVGADISPTSIDRLREQFPDVSFQHADITQPSPNLFERQFAQIYALDVLYHIVDDDRFASALENTAQWCEPGGYFIFTDSMNDETLVPNAPVPHVKLRSAAEYKSVLEPLGYRIVTTQPMYHFLNRPLIGNRFPWTHRRLARFIRRRVCETYLVRNGLYWLDAVKLSLSWQTKNVKIVVCQKDGEPPKESPARENDPTSIN